ncbi:hypothetical protein CHS0354_019261 [Potamilus streckersoni]|uniref:Small ribosomal subunit protein bS16m n=1 Tax=Potamilus streckersoni TaxID=2493646 RepID=A0AAE0SLW0_9BIVA|nr:hypothetical protein CHS0354_019261 [Potamilus streckersoni]
MPSIPDKSTRFMIRLARWGCTNRPFYHIVVLPNRKPRNMRPHDQLGSIDPMTNLYGEVLVSINFDRLKYWLNRGAHISKPVEHMLGLAGFLPVHPTSYLQAMRNRKKAEQQIAESMKEEKKSVGGQS